MFKLNYYFFLMKSFYTVSQSEGLLLRFAITNKLFIRKRFLKKHYIGRVDVLVGSLPKIIHLSSLSTNRLIKTIQYFLLFNNIGVLEIQRQYNNRFFIENPYYRNSGYSSLNNKPIQLPRIKKNYVSNLFNMYGSLMIDPSIVINCNWSDNPLKTYFVHYYRVFQQTLSFPYYMSAKSFSFYIISALIYKNPRLLWLYFYKLFVNINFYQSRIWLINFALKSYKGYRQLLMEFGVSGLSIKFRGTLSKFAGKRKQRFTIRIGAPSLSTRTTKKFYFFKPLWSKNGSIGCSVLIVA